MPRDEAEYVRQLPAMASVTIYVFSVRYIASDLPDAIADNHTQYGFLTQSRPGPGCQFRGLGGSDAGHAKQPCHDIVQAVRWCFTGCNSQANAHNGIGA